MADVWSAAMVFLESPAICAVAGALLGAMISNRATRTATKEQQAEAERERSFRRAEAARAETAQRADRRQSELVDAYTKVLTAFDQAMTVRRSQVAGEPSAESVSDCMKRAGEWSHRVGMLDDDEESQRTAAHLYAFLTDKRWSEAMAKPNQGGLIEKVSAESRVAKAKLLLRLRERFAVHSIDRPALPGGTAVS